MKCLRNTGNRMSDEWMVEKNRIYPIRHHEDTNPHGGWFRSFAVLATQPNTQGSP